MNTRKKINDGRLEIQLPKSLLVEFQKAVEEETGSKRHMAKVIRKFMAEYICLNYAIPERKLPKILGQISNDTYEFASKIMDNKLKEE